MQPFVAIDFETANGKRASACSIGLARFDENGDVAGSYHSLILPHPEHRFFHPANIWVHGIREEDVTDSAEWGELFREVSDFIGDLPLTAHNFAFDGSVLNQLADLYQHAPMDNHRYCTLRLARRLYPELPKKSLNVVFDHLFPGEVLNHHHAESDAIAAGRIFAHMQRQRSLDELMDLIGPAPRPRSATKVRPSVDSAVSVAQLVEHYGQSRALQGGERVLHRHPGTWKTFRHGGVSRSCRRDRLQECHPEDHPAGGGRSEPGNVEGGILSLKESGTRDTAPREGGTDQGAV